MNKSVVSLCILVFATAAFAEDTIKAENPGELGSDQKLARVYDLYRKGDVVSLKPSEMQIGIGAAYASGSKDSFGSRQSSRMFTAQAFASRGIGAGMEVSVTIPYVAQSLRVETSDAVLANNSVSGIGDPTLRFVGMLPAEKVVTSAIFAATLPMGNRALSSRETHTSMGASWGKVLRPAFVSAGVTWERDWKSHVNGLGYSAGLGFFLNHALSVGGQISGVAMFNPQTGSMRDSTSMGIRVAYQETPDLGIVASVDFGIATDTPQATVGVTAYWRL